jgi:hypothetical protein
MIKDGFDLLTYRAGRCRRIHERRFIRRQIKAGSVQLVDPDIAETIRRKWNSATKQ